MRFLLVSVTDNISPHSVEIHTLEDLLTFINCEGEDNDIIISKRSLVSIAHDRIQDNENCSHVLCLYDDFIEPGELNPTTRKRLNQKHARNV
jgi:hypothetical protein